MKGLTKINKKIVLKLFLILLFCGIFFSVFLQNILAEQSLQKIYDQDWDVDDWAVIWDRDGTPLHSQGQRHDDYVYWNKNVDVRVYAGEKLLYESRRKAYLLINYLDNNKNLIRQYTFGAYEKREVNLESDGYIRFPQGAYASEYNKLVLAKNVIPALTASCSASPNPANTNQTVTFSSSVSGGSGSYIYSWTGACTGSSANCDNSFSTAGTHTAYLTVTSGTQTASTNCSVNVNQTCTPNSYRQCYNDDVYWYDSCGVRGSLYQTCGQSGWTDNYRCSCNWLQRQWANRGCSSTACYETLNWSNYEYCSQGCQNNQCVSLPSLTVSCSASPNPANTNQTVNFISQVSGGSGSYRYSWTGACTGTGANCSTSFSSAGTRTATVIVTSGTQTASANCSVNVQTPVPTLTASCSASPNPVNTNQTVNFISQVSGGSGSYIYSWTGACTGSSANCDNSFSTAGTHTAYLTVTSGTQTASTNCSVNVNQTVNPNAYFSCWNNDLYWFDSLGNRQGLYQNCGTSYCTDTGTNYCVGNSVYRQRTCYNRGCAGNACYSSPYTETIFVQNCGTSQVCQNGVCVSSQQCTSGPCCENGYFKPSSAICNSETQTEYGCPWGFLAGSNVGMRTRTRYQYCSGTSADCNGLWSNWSNYSNWTVAAYCSLNQTCVVGFSTCQPYYLPTQPPTYVVNHERRCYDNDVYWFDSLGVRQDKYRECSDNNECTIDGCRNGVCFNNLKCDGTTCSIGSNGYCNSCNSCGDNVCNCGETAQSCSQDCQVIGLALTLFGKKEGDSVQWLKTFNAGSGQKLDFLAVISNGEERVMNNVTVRVNLPSEVIYKGDLKLDGNVYSGDIREGISLGNLNPGIIKTLTFKGEVAPQNLILRNEAGIIGMITTENGSSSDNVKIYFGETPISSSQETGWKPQGALAAIAGFDFSKPLYGLLAIVVAIIILFWLVKMFKGIRNK